MKFITINGIKGLGKVEMGGTYITKAFYDRLIGIGVRITIIEDDCYIDGKDCVQIS
ncbi:MAG: hypothetical protein ACTSSO_07140 [Candidatus Hodarchaeales archaeon]